MEWTEAIQKLKDFFLRRQQFYRTVFLDGEATKEVLKDLSRFCRADVSTFHPDARVHAHLEGRREVWLRIHHHLTLTEAEFYARYGTKEGKERDEE